MSYRILSLSGGGIRGIFQAVYLRLLAERLKAPIHEVFDLIAGTSTGAIIAAGLAIGADAGRAESLFRAWGPKIFARRWFSPVRRGARYSAEPLRKALESFYKDAKLDNCHTELAITGTVLEHFKCRVFSHLREGDTVNEFDRKLSLAEVVLASCAAPTFFPPARLHGEERTFVDGGLWANAPLLVAVIYAHKYRNVPFEHMRVVHVGNGELAAGPGAAAFASLRPISPKLVRIIFDMMFAAQSDMAERAVRIIIGEQNVAHIKPLLDSPISPDDVRQALGRLPALAQDMAFNHSDKVIQLLAE